MSHSKFCGYLLYLVALGGLAAVAPCMNALVLKLCISNTCSRSMKSTSLCDPLTFGLGIQCKKKAVNQHKASPLVGANVTMLVLKSLEIAPYNPVRHLPVAPKERDTLPVVNLHACEIGYHLSVTLHLFADGRYRSDLPIRSSLSDMQNLPQQQVLSTLGHQYSC